MTDAVGALWGRLESLAAQRRRNRRNRAGAWVADVHAHVRSLQCDSDEGRVQVPPGTHVCDCNCTNRKDGRRPCALHVRVDRGEVHAAFDDARRSPARPRTRIHVDPPAPIVAGVSGARFARALRVPRGDDDPIPRVETLGIDDRRHMRLGDGQTMPMTDELRDEEEVRALCRDLAISALQLSSWQRAADRRQRLRTYCAERFHRRFGIEWQSSWTLGLLSKPPPALCSGAPRSSRSRLAWWLDRRPPFMREPRFLSVEEQAWVSLLCGHYPEGIDDCEGPRAVILAERESMKKAIARWGQRPIGATIRRGPQRRRQVSLSGKQQFLGGRECLNR